MSARETYQPRISVVIPNYNYGHYLTETVDSVLAQSYPNLECIIVDDGSTDNSKVIIKRLQEKDARVKPVFKQNGGLSSARNAGMKAALGELITFVDSDDLWKKDKLENQVNYLRQNSGCNFVFSTYIAMYPDGKEEPFEHIFGNTQLTDYIKQNPIAGSASSAMLTKELANKAGYFDETLRSTEDHDYWFRCFLQGAKIGFCDHYDVKIRMHSTSMSKNLKRMNENNFRVLIKQVIGIKKYLPEQLTGQVKKLVNIKIQSLLWIARDTADFKLMFKLYAAHVKHLGPMFTVKEFLKNNLLYDIRLIIKRAMASKNRTPVHVDIV